MLRPPLRLLALLSIAAGGLFFAACSGSSSSPDTLAFEKSSAPAEATLIKGGDLPYTVSDDKRIERTYALFGCNCTFDQVLSHYVSTLTGQGYQRVDESTEPRARFIDNPPKNLVEISVLDLRFHPASFILGNSSLSVSDQDNARKYNTAYVITLTRLP